MFEFSNSQGAGWGDKPPVTPLTGGIYARFTDTAAIPPRR
jgi:hypothetical protein